MTETVEAPKRRPGRPKGSKNRPKETAPDLEAETTALVQGAFELLALVTRRPYWRVSIEEAQLVGRPLGRILSRYLDPEKMSRYSDLTQLVTGMAVILAPRLALTVQEKREARKRAEPQHAGGSVANPGPEANRKPSGSSGDGADPIKNLLPAIVG